ncbi:MAG TPA: DUF6152 family protein [Vicinamibacterales bacterium]|nr:DUF6152 family protein [Vicinamibacterales bacterium]
MRFRIGVLLILLACSVPAYSHHSFAGAYFESDSVTIEGDVVEFVYRAPHAWLYVQAADPSGRTQRYGAEWASPSRLEREGVGKDTFQVGDQVSITGAPGRDQNTHQIHLKKVTRYSRGRWSWEGRQGPR